MAVYLDGNDNLLTLTGLTDSVTSSYINNASVSVTLVDADGAEVAGQSWPLSLDYVTDSDAVYRATLIDTLTASPGERLTARVSANAGAGLQGYWELPITVIVRTTS